MADEYISRKEAMEYLYRALNADPYGNCPSCVHDEHDCQYDRCWTLMDFCEKIEYLGYVPAADVVPVRHGRWEEDCAGAAVCSVCGEYAFETSTHHLCWWFPNYCPNCGAKMDLEDMGGEGNGKD